MAVCCDCETPLAPGEMLGGISGRPHCPGCLESRCRLEMRYEQAADEIADWLERRPVARLLLQAAIDPAHDHD